VIVGLSRWRDLLLYTALGLTGLLVVFHVPLRSGFTHQQPAPTDPRLVTWVLERNHQWFLGERPDESFWSPAFFHPWPKVGTHTESMLGLQPFYSPWRFIGLSPETAYALCGLGLLAACFASATWFLRAGAGLSPLAASAGGFLFAFALPRSAHLGHFQLFAHYATPLALLAVVSIVRSTAAGTPRRLPIWLLALTGWLQLLGSVYLVWFLCFLLALAGIGALFLPSGRAILWRLLRERWGTWLTTVLVLTVATWPVLGPYLDTGSRIKANTFENVQPLLPTWRSLLYPGRGSWEGEWLGISHLPSFTERPFPGEHALFSGVATTLLALAGCWLGRRRPLVFGSVAVAAVALGLVLIWPGGVTAWRWLYLLLPGGEAVRGISRIGLPLLLVMGLGVGLAIEWLAERRRVFAVLAVILIVVESGQTQGAYAVAPVVARSRFIAATLPAACDAFLYTVVRPKAEPAAVFHLEAMWAGLLAGKPTVNGYSGYPPRGWWPPTEPFLRDRALPLDLPRLANRLVAQGSTLQKLCWLRLDLRGDAPTGTWTMTSTVGEPASVTITPAIPDA
jgi:hypothetical protein